MQIEESANVGISVSDITHFTIVLYSRTCVRKELESGRGEWAMGGVGEA